jgi:hypothetical protein
MTVTIPAGITVGAIVHINPQHADVAPAAFVDVPLELKSLPRARNEKNAIVCPPGGGRGLRIPPAYLVPGAPAEGRPNALSVAAVGATILQTGTLVRYDGAEGLWVVAGFSGRGHRIFPLGGSDRYYRGVPASRLTVIPADKVSVAD